VTRRAAALAAGIAIGAIVGICVPAGLLLPVGRAASVRAPDFRLPLLGGGTTGLSAYKGKPVILLFWAPWCPTCNGEAPGWERAYDEAKAKGVAVLGIGLLDGRQACRGFVTRHHLTFPNAYDADGRVAKAYGFTYQPYWAVISRAGVLVRHEYGPTSQAELRTTIDMLAER
jgi:cytochrome c biogenesis protein CcmG/thiol:disulfide interchange protein DsbE